MQLLTFLAFGQNPLFRRVLGVAEPVIRRVIIACALWMRLVLFLTAVEGSSVVKHIVEDVVELAGHAVVRILTFQRIFLHLKESVALEDVFEEAIVGLFQTL